MLQTCMLLLLAAVPADRHLQDWLVLDSYPRDAEERQCVNWSDVAWHVRTGHTTVVATRYQHERRTAPFSLPRWKAKRYHNLELADVYYRRVDDGWLVGLNAGHMGSLVLWLSNDERRKYLMQHHPNIVGFAGAAPGVIAVGYSEASRRDLVSVVLTFEKRGRKWRSRLATEFPGKARTFLKEGERSLLVLTDQGIFRVNLRGGYEEVHRNSWGDLGPTSLAVLDNGVVYVGLQVAVVRLIPEGDDYREEWLVPPECATLQRDLEHYRCRCVGTAENAAALGQ